MREVERARGRLLGARRFETMRTRAWLLVWTALAAACGSGVAATMDAGPEGGESDGGTRDAPSARDGGRDATRRDSEADATEDATLEASTDAGADTTAADASADARDAGGTDSRKEASSGCTPPAALPGEPCDGSTVCGSGLACDLNGSWTGGLGPDASICC